MRQKAEALYDHFSPLYWVKYGIRHSETHQSFLQAFLDRVPPGSRLFSAGCGAGRFDGHLLEAGHSVVGTDLSAGMLARAKARFPEILYEQKALHELDYQNEFEGMICIDALEHVFPEEWPLIVRGFQEALTPGGVLYFTLDTTPDDDLEAAYEQARAQGLPVVLGEVVADLEDAYKAVTTVPFEKVPDELCDKAVYHYYPSDEQVGQWLDQEQFTVEAEGLGTWYRHIVARKNS